MAVQQKKQRVGATQRRKVLVNKLRTSGKLRSGASSAHFSMDQLQQMAGAAR